MLSSGNVPVPEICNQQYWSDQQARNRARGAGTWKSPASPSPRAGRSGLSETGRRPTVGPEPDDLAVGAPHLLDVAALGLVPDRGVDAAVGTKRDLSTVVNLLVHAIPGETRRAAVGSPHQKRGEVLRIPCGRVEPPTFSDHRVRILHNVLDWGSMRAPVGEPPPVRRRRRRRRRSECTFHYGHRSQKYSYRGSVSGLDVNGVGTPSVNGLRARPGQPTPTFSRRRRWLFFGGGGRR